METMLHSGMNEFIAAIYRQHQNAAYMNAAYLESYKELAKLQAHHEQAQKDHLRRLENEKIRELEKKRLDSKPAETSSADDMSTSSGKDISGLCRVCGSSADSIGSIPKADLTEPILNCLQIDVRKDKKIHPPRVCQGCSEQLTHAMIQFTTMGNWPLLRIQTVDWNKNNQDCSLAQTLPAICTIAAKHGFLLVPEHTDERRVRFVRLTELGSNDVSASYILHLYRDLTWDLAIHGHSVLSSNLFRLPRKVTHECAELFFTSILALKLCPGIAGLDPICRIISQNGPAVFHDNENKRLAIEDRFAKTVRHNECLLISDEGGQCDACNKYQPVAKQFQDQYLSIAQMQKNSDQAINLTPQSSKKRRESDDESENEMDMPSAKKAKLHETNGDSLIERPVMRKKSDLTTTSSSRESFKIGSIGSHPASGLSLLAESASRLPLTADRPNMREQLLAKAVEKKQACGRCDRCLRLDDCGQCDYCLDKPKFGGPNTKRRKCRLRTCVFYRQSQNGGRRRQNHQANGRNIMASASMVAAALGPNYLHENFPTNLSTTECKEDVKIEKENKSGTSNDTSSPDAGHTRRRPALQCHKCKHCASPDCAKCRFCLDKPKFGGPGRLKQKCVERRCILERQQDAEIRKEKERKAANALLAKEALIANQTLETFKLAASTPLLVEPELRLQIEEIEEKPEIRPTQETDEVVLKVDEDDDIEIDIEADEPDVEN